MALSLTRHRDNYNPFGCLRMFLRVSTQVQHVSKLGREWVSHWTGDTVLFEGVVGRCEGCMLDRLILFRVGVCSLQWVENLAEPQTVWSW